MRLREIIKETGKANRKKLTKDALDAIPGALRWDGLDNSSPYHSYRFGVALAGMPDYMMPLDGPVGQKMVTIGYTEADDEILKATGKNLGFSGVVLTPRGSAELDDTNVRSPVNDWNKPEKKKFKEGVMQTGDPGMGTPEANKAGWGSGNYISQRPGSWNGTAECMGDELDQSWSKKMKLLKKVNRLKSTKVKEAATSGATSAGNIASTGVNPALSPGPARGKKSYTGTPGHSGTKAPPQPKPKKQKPTDNALNMKGVSIFGQPIKR
jgi:hypothetical protein